MRDRHYSLLKITFPVDNWVCVPIGKQFSVGIILWAESLRALWALSWTSCRSSEDGKSISLQSWRHINLMSRIMSPSGAKVRHICLQPLSRLKLPMFGAPQGWRKTIMWSASIECPALPHGTGWARGTCADLKLMLLALLWVIKSLVSTQAFCVSPKQPSKGTRVTCQLASKVKSQVLLVLRVTWSNVSWLVSSRCLWLSNLC